MGVPAVAAGLWLTTAGAAQRSLRLYNDDVDSMTYFSVVRAK